MMAYADCPILTRVFASLLETPLMQPCRRLYAFPKAVESINMFEQAPSEKGESSFR
jgi:hypothetical protein